MPIGMQCNTVNVVVTCDINVNVNNLLATCGPAMLVACSWSTVGQQGARDAVAAGAASTEHLAELQLCLGVRREDTDAVRSAWHEMA